MSTAAATRPARARRTRPASPEADFLPVHVAEVELSRPLPDLPAGGEAAWVLVRLHTEPLGVVRTRLSEAGLPAQDLADLVWARLYRPIIDRLDRAGVPAPVRLKAEGLDLDPHRSPFLRERREILSAAPSVTVVVCTRDRADRLGTCLESLSRQDYPSYDVVVVDNAPRDDTVQSLVRDRHPQPPWRYVREPRAGLSRARNTGARHARGRIVAFLDDDETPDEHWLAELARGFATGPDVGCVSGMIVPRRLDTSAQDLFERLGGHCKGRGFEPAVFTRDGPQNPLYPLPPFGTGGNMAFRREVLRAVGRFDEALGAGTPALAGEDTLAITRVLLAGHRVVYQPTALVRHDHRVDPDALAEQLRGYRVGLTAYYSALVRDQPSLLLPLLRLLPRGLWDLYGGAAARPAEPAGRSSTPSRRGGLLVGPVAYARGRRALRRDSGPEGPR
jgi:glycosyltransferase involved in cell wall biosynthesis